MVQGCAHNHKNLFTGHNLKHPVHLSNHNSQRQIHFHHRTMTEKHPCKRHAVARKFSDNNWDRITFLWSSTLISKVSHLQVWTCKYTANIWQKHVTRNIVQFVQYNKIRDKIEHTTKTRYAWVNTVSAQCFRSILNAMNTNLPKIIPIGNFKVVTINTAYKITRPTSNCIA